MARALQCPTCGTKTRLDGVTSDTFECQTCGQVLKVPPAARGAGRQARAGGDGPAPPPRRSAPSAPAPSAPAPSAPAPSDPAPSAAPEPPRRVAPPRPPAPVTAAAAGATSALPPRDLPRASRSPAGDGGPPRRAKVPRDALPLGVRIGAWVLAVPVGLVIVGVPARILGYLTSQKLLDVFVKHTVGRFVPLLVIVVLWALATTILVEVFVEGGRWLMLRRRPRQGGGPGVDRSGPPPRVDPGTPPPRVPPRQRRSAARARGS